jgi:FtsZ-binding cell division protein ZapB
MKTTPTKSAWEKLGISEPIYHEDPMMQLRAANGTPALLLWIEEFNNAIKQHCARAADEMERLREENKQLRKNNAVQWHAKRMADTIRMHFEMDPPMPEIIAITLRDYQNEQTTPL